MGTSGERRTIENISNNVEKRIQRAFPEQKFVLREDKNRFIIESPANVGNPSGRFFREIKVSPGLGHAGLARQEAGLGLAEA